MEMYKRPRSESNIVHRLQKLGFRETMGYTDGSFQLMKQDRSATILVSDDGEQFHYYGPEGTATHKDAELDGEEWYKQLLRAIYLPVIEPGMLVAYDPGYKVEFGKVKRPQQRWYKGLCLVSQWRYCSMHTNRGSVSD